MVIHLRVWSQCFCPVKCWIGELCNELELCPFCSSKSLVHQWLAANTTDWCNSLTFLKAYIKQIISQKCSHHCLSFALGWVKNTMKKKKINRKQIFQSHCSWTAAVALWFECGGVSCSQVQVHFILLTQFLNFIFQKESPS